MIKCHLMPRALIRRWNVLTRERHDSRFAISSISPELRQIAKISGAVHFLALLDTRE